MPVNLDIHFYSDLLGDIKSRIRQAQIKATLSANAEMRKQAVSQLAILPQPVAKIHITIKGQRFVALLIQAMKVPQVVAQFASYLLSLFLQQLVAKIDTCFDVSERGAQYEF